MKDFASNIFLLSFLGYQFEKEKEMNRENINYDEMFTIGEKSDKKMRCLFLYYLLKVPIFNKLPCISFWSYRLFLVDRLC